ncbi:hypothetical protein ACOMHN_053809 [Nucella lapillus]
MRVTWGLALCVAALAVTVVSARRRDRANGKGGCEYSRESDWSACGPGVSSRHRELRLRPGSPDHCPASRTLSKPCRTGRRSTRRLKNNRKKRKGCKYGRKSEWSECGPGVTVRQRVRRLKPGGADHCPHTQTITKPCRGPSHSMHTLKKKGRGKGCKYTKGPWQPCNKITNLKKRELTLRRGKPSVCSAVRTIEKPCRRRGAFTSAKISQCRYEALPWGECSSRTNTMTRVHKLKAGDPALCQRTKNLTRKCRRPCKFSKGQWSACDGATGLKKRTDHLVKGDTSMCEASRVISKMCGKEHKCLYAMGNWSDCDQESRMRNRIKTLTSGHHQDCEPQITTQRPCLKPDGEEDCFHGNWGDYGPCQNGVMMKHRPVIAGGMECERKAVKAKPCP